ncbi:MAG TPA: SulP family inorganic anion transporter [Saprospiraceae bacterium]|nr:SulP family inorganic anion transporter [Saprospiraceae bacterium]HPN69940.1 SulP family inorganic anion transporter [Saprospiraceae bacterium]
MKKSYNKFKPVDISASIVVFLVALPLCLGIALASGAPLFSGLIAGVVGGIVVGAISGSRVGVSGPAAGLTVVVLDAITGLGSFPVFLSAVILAGILQIGFGLMKLGRIAYFFPSSVIKGMLTAIGLLIILKQIPHALGIDLDYEGDESFVQADGKNTFTEFLQPLQTLLPAAIVISIIGIMILVLWDSKLIKGNKILKMIPGALIVVVFGVVANLIMPENLKLGTSHLVNLPLIGSLSEVPSLFTLPDFSRILEFEVIKVAFIIAVIASVETLLCVEATDKLDKSGEITPTNRELFAQGAGNVVSGLIGGIPVTQVIVRSSANIQANANSKYSAIFHGLILLITAILIPFILNLIPLSALAAVLVMVGYKLANPKVFKQMWAEGQDQFVPFMVTIVAILFTDLLIGISIGFAFGLIYVLLTNFRSSVSIVKEGNLTILRLNKDVFFFNKAEIIERLSAIQPGDRVYIDGSAAKFIDHDIYLTLEEFVEEAKNKDIEVEWKSISRKKINFINNYEVVSKTLASK